MAEVTARHLLSQKAGNVVVLNRTIAKAKTMADLLKGTASPLEDMEKELLSADIVLCSVSTSQPLLSADDMKKIMEKRRGRSIYFVDIAVPRNIDPKIHELDNAYVYNIDDLQEIVDENMSSRKKDVQEAEKIVTHLSNEFYGWIEAVLEGRSAALSHDHSPVEPS
jgi:glutamyl-tRNA reductase